MAESDSPSLSPSASESPSASPSLSPSASESPSASPSASPSLSPSASASPSLSPSASASPSLSPSASASPSASPSASRSLSPSASASPSASPSLSPSASASPSVSPSIDPRTENNYEISSDGVGKHWIVPVARLENAAILGPVLAADHAPTAILGLLPGTQQTGTILSADTINGVPCVVVDTHSEQVFYHFVRNVTSYRQGEFSWGVINIGDPIYYDRSGTMPAGVYLSTSPLDAASVANPLFGFAASSQAWPLPTTVAGANTASVPVQQV